MHGTMKASLKAKLGSDPNWRDTLPVVLLGMRAAVKQDINWIWRRWSMGSSCVYLVSFSQHQLPTATHVFVRVDAHKSPLQAPNKGPFKVLERHSKYFKLDLGNR